MVPGTDTESLEIDYLLYHGLKSFRWLQPEQVVSIVIIRDLMRRQDQICKVRLFRPQSMKPGKSSTTHCPPLQCVTAKMLDELFYILLDSCALHRVASALSALTLV